MQIPGSNRKRPVDGSTPSSSASSPKLTLPQQSALPGGVSARVAVSGAIAAAVLVAALTGGGSGIFTQTQAFLDFGAGVLSLVSFSVTVLWGLAATDRWILQPNHRLIAQGVHRATAVSGVSFLLLHIWAKIATKDTNSGSAVLPFADVNKPLLVGLGTIASYLFIAVIITGALRSVFTSPTRARRWRILHICAYPAWGAALIHGLKAGRPAAGWVTTGYALCLIGVGIAIVLRKNAKPGTPVAMGPRAPLGEFPRPEGRSLTPLPGKPSQNPVGLLDRPVAALPEGTLPGAAGSRPEHERPWSVSGEPSRDPQSPWLTDTGSLGQPLAQPHPTNELPRAEPSPLLQDDPLTTTGQLSTTGLTPAVGPAPRSGAPLQQYPGEQTGSWAVTEPRPDPLRDPLPPEPLRQPMSEPLTQSMGAPWPGPSGGPAQAPPPVQQPGGPQPPGDPWSTGVRPPGGEPWQAPQDVQPQQQPRPQQQRGRRVTGGTNGWTQ